MTALETILDSVPATLCFLLLSAAILASAIAWPVAYYHAQKTRAAIEAGLVEIPDSSQSTHWGKP